MKLERRNTIDSAHGSWPLCQYYYTHNMGSCDDILLQKGTEHPLSNESIPNKKRYTYPNLTVDKSPFRKPPPKSVARRWRTTIRRQRYTQDSLDIQSFHDNNTSMLYSTQQPQRHNSHSDKVALETTQEKTELPKSVTRSKSHEEKTTVSRNETDTLSTTTRIDDEFNINSSLVAHPPSTDPSESSVDEEYFMVMIPSPPSTSTCTTADMFLFLFGFLFFPLWWIGACRYWLYRAKKPRYETFQILNIAMSVASLLLLGLIIGLTTVWS